MWGGGGRKGCSSGRRKNAWRILRSMHDTWQSYGQQNYGKQYLRSEPQNIQRPGHLHKVSQDIFAIGGDPQRNSQLERSLGYMQIFQLWPCTSPSDVALCDARNLSQISIFVTDGWIHVGPTFCSNGPHLVCNVCHGMVWYGMVWYV